MNGDVTLRFTFRFKVSAVLAAGSMAIAVCSVAARRWLALVHFGSSSSSTSCCQPVVARDDTSCLQGLGVSAVSNIGFAYDIALGSFIAMRN